MAKGIDYRNVLFSQWPETVTRHALRGGGGCGGDIDHGVFNHSVWRNCEGNFYLKVIDICAEDGEQVCVCVQLCLQQQQQPNHV